MRYRFLCPECGAGVSAEGSLLGHTVPCPECETGLGLPESAPEMAAISFRIHGDAKIPPPAPSALEYLARERGIQLDQPIPNHFQNKKLYQAGLAALRRDLPRAFSAYMPSGKCSPLSLATLPLGTVIAIPFGVLIGGLALGIVLILAAIMGALSAFAALKLEFVAFALTGFTLLITFGGYGIMFIAIGIANAAVIDRAGKLGKNRNAWLGAIVAMGSTVATVVVFRWALAALLEHVQIDALAKVSEALISNWAWVVYGIGGLIAVFAAGITASTCVAENKFCETCDTYLSETVVKKITYPEAQLLARLCREYKADPVAEVLPLMEGDFAAAKLFHCLKCQCGYLEAEVAWKATYLKEEGIEKENPEWRVASIWLWPKHTFAIAALIPAAAKSPLEVALPKRPLENPVAD